jgi:hypothetical protein
VLEDVHGLVLGRRVVEERQVPGPHGDHEDPAGHRHERESRQRAPERCARPERRRHPAADGARQPPENQRQRIAQRHQRRRDHDEQQMLDHVHREERVRLLVEGEQRHRDGHEPDHVENGPPPGWPVAGRAQAAPAAQVRDEDDEEEERAEGRQHVATALKNA